jgi:SnoaL-like domain
LIAFNRRMLTLAEISDRREIQQPLVDHSTAVDQRRFDDLDCVLTPDAYIDFWAVERGRVFGSPSLNL